MSSVVSSRTGIAWCKHTPFDAGTSMCEAAGGNASGDMSFRRLMTRATISIITWRDACVNSSAAHKRVNEGELTCLG